MIRMPGKSHRGPLPPLTDAEASLADLLRRHVEVLAGDIGERTVWKHEALAAAADYIEAAFAARGLTHVARQTYVLEGRDCDNLEVGIAGADSSRSDEIVIVGAHYDSVVGAPGANDNGSGVAALLELAGRFASAAADGRGPKRTLRFVAFVNEEPTWFGTEAMGSHVYAKRCRARDEDVVAMLSLETMGWFDDAQGSQQYPFPLGALYPSEGNFIGFVGNLRSRALVHRCVAAFRACAAFPSEGAALPEILPGVGWSDHKPFWDHGYPALMVTDTAPFRYPHYHTAEDTPDKVDCEKLARVVGGLEAVIAELAGAGSLR
jgi:hypothetical protein